ncbi:bifunctional diaminohydroxyphosphoribosylaminopyrimidine deaminase/5-amino-6-(5-phosphoribosylamino)uracil reductase RibD [Agaribacter flavus]|uniref:Riboflavin biosynthesis protein RibD n=1 Tax=Agaribacter flavus TaxID=1902781 RepID=A0ABV7FTP0_9ALTE
MNAIDDAKYMAYAISLAKKGQYSTTPNPQVGCVIVKNNKIVGEGYHKKAGEPHAEIHALRSAGENAQGADVYVTLEPCSHTGRTGPCTQALIEAGVQRVVIACTDPNPLVSGRGVNMLKDANVNVTLGVLEQKAKKVNVAFFNRMQKKRPYLIAKLACSLDGKTALANGKSQWITSEAAREDVQVERARACAILTGANTVISDDPRLTVRSDSLEPATQSAFNYRGKQALRVIIDGKNRLSSQFQLFKDGNQNLVFNLKENQSLVSLPGTRQHQIKSVGEHVDLHEALQYLAIEEHINLVWVEAGASLCGALLSEGLIDELIVYQAPLILGDKGRDLLVLPELTDLKKAISAPFSSITRVGNDVKYRIKLDSTNKTDRS